MPQKAERVERGIIEGTVKPLVRVTRPFIARTCPFVGFLLDQAINLRTVKAGCRL
jgi:hypothetical protein